MKHFKRFTLSAVALIALALFTFVGVSPAHAATVQHQQPIIHMHPAACSGSITADSAAGTNPGYSIGLPVWWSENCSGNVQIEYGWGDGTGWFWQSYNLSSGSATYYHTWSSPGNYTVTWRLWVHGFAGGEYVEATTYTYVSIY